MIRLDKYLSMALGITRKEALYALKAQKVLVQDIVVKKGAQKINENDKVVFEGNQIGLSGPRYFMMNKAQGYVCTHDDANNPTIFSSLDEISAEKMHTAGRLDCDTTGLVLLTDDGQWSHRVTSPKHQCAKTYQVKLAAPISDEAQEAFTQGIELRGEKQKTLPAQLIIIDEKNVLLTIYEGKYHQVKRMFAAVGNKVIALHRKSIGSLALDPSLEPGEYRKLTEKEIALF